MVVVATRPPSKRPRTLAVCHRVGRPARDQVKEGVARLAQHLELELDLAVQ